MFSIDLNSKKVSLKVNLSKMTTSFNSSFDSVQYYLPLSNSFNFEMNKLIGKFITLKNLNQINCIHCGKNTNKSFNQGYCEVCSKTLAECDTCRVKPALCSYYDGNCRDNSWGEKNCFKQHLIYISFTGSHKVGISRYVNNLNDDYSSRWIDQGATSAIPFLRVNNRLLAGMIENIIKKHISDGTNWLKMLKYQKPDTKITFIANTIKEKIKSEIDILQSEYGLNCIQWADTEIVKHIVYPAIRYPSKINSIIFHKEKEYSGFLVAIKGQYLIFDDGKVINFRKYAGYLTEISYFF